MPNIGTFKSKIFCGTLGVKLFVTELGPPERMTPLGLILLIFSSSISQGRISE